MKTIYTKDLANKKIFVTREFDAPIEQVWQAWTDKDILDKWWAPKPWKAETQSMDFRIGGKWLYCMVGPEGERHYCRNDYDTIDAPNGFSGRDGFADENGNVVSNPPGMHWDVKFTSIGPRTKVEVTVTFATEKDLQTIVDMGFEEGFAMAHDNLDELLAG